MSFAVRLRALGSDTALYSVANLAARLFTFLLLPLYTNVLAPGEYGPIGTVYGYIALGSVVWSFGFEAAFLRFAAPDERRDEREVAATSFLAVLAFGAALSLLVTATAPAIAGWIGLAGHTRYIGLAAGIVWLDAIAVVPLAMLRLARRLGGFAFVRTTSLLTHLAFNLVLLVGLKRGASGILEANLISSATEAVLLMVLVRRSLSLSFRTALLGELLRFATPLVPAGLAAMIVQVGDRPILQFLAGDAAAGVYQASAKIANAMLLLVTGFTYAWQPFFLSRASDDDARPLFARILTYFVTLAMAAFLAVALFVDLAVKLPIGGGRTLIDEPYWQGLAVIPWLLLGHIAGGVYAILAMGPMWHHRTRHFPSVAGAAALVSVALNFLLVPRLGLVGVGVVALAAALVQTGGMWLIARGLYPVRYEWGRLVRPTACALLLWAAFAGFGGAALGVVPRLALLAAFPAALAASGFLSADERRTLARRLGLAGSAETPGSDSPAQ